MTNKEETFYRVVDFSTHKSRNDGILKKDIMRVLKTGYKEDIDWSAGPEVLIGGGFSIWFYNQDLYFLFVLTFREYCHLYR